VALELSNAPGQTPLDPDEAAGLLPRHLTSQGQLNEWEQANILQAVRWLTRARVPEVLTEEFCRELHRRMFERTWVWAGQFRQSDKNIGCDWRQIATRLGQLFGNVQYWLVNSVFSIDEIATRFHHELVLVHAFPNGNGRHSRLMTDCLLRQCAAKPFTWGGNHDLVAPGDARQRYLASLRAADAGDLGQLMQFVRS
jgi:Fic-DOC domain mobile mystery protein B